MHVIKRDGRKETVKFDKITSRIKKLCYQLHESVDSTRIAQKVCSGVYSGVSTSALDELAAETAAHLITEHPDFGILAARIAVSNLHKNTSKSFSGVAQLLYEYVDKKTNTKAPLLSEEVYGFIQSNKEELNSHIIYDRDYDYDYFGFKTLERSYLLKVNKKVVERPQHMLMRVACEIHCGDLVSVLQTYTHLSSGFFTHASPTLYYSGTPNPQLSSCFLLTIKGDSISGIYETLKDTAIISKGAGGVGLSVHKIRASGSYIRGTQGESNGIVPMLRVFNNTARYVDQGGGKRKGAFAIYLEPWHADILSFLDLRKNHGIEERRARDLFYGLWVPDLFMKRAEADQKWSLFCPNVCPGLEDVWGEKFDALYCKYEQEGKATQIIKARQLLELICDTQIETGTPYMMYKDACNRKSNQRNLGTIKSSNLCTEIIEYTSPDEVAVCNLASICLPKFVVQSKDTSGKEEDVKQVLVFDYKKLEEVTQVVTVNLNRIIDRTRYPIPEARKSNLQNRPIGIGIQGLADTFALLGLPFESEEAQKVNLNIFETIYFSALTASLALAKKEGAYMTFKGSPLSDGLFQFDLWDKQPHSERYNWNALREEIKTYGVRNSLLVAPMPTASTAHILGNSECFEPYTSNLYFRRTQSGEFVCVSKHLLRELVKLNLWTREMRNKIISKKGSIQNVKEIPRYLQEIYKTVWEMKNATLINMAADRGMYIDQSQSMSLFMSNPTRGKLLSFHFYGWKKGLKTGMYYLRTQSATEAVQFTVDQKMVQESSVDFFEEEQKTAKSGPSFIEPKESPSTPDSPSFTQKSSDEQSPKFSQTTSSDFITDDRKQHQSLESECSLKLVASTSALSDGGDQQKHAQQQQLTLDLSFKVPDFECLSCSS